MGMKFKVRKHRYSLLDLHWASPIMGAIQHGQDGHMDAYTNTFGIARNRLLARHELKYHFVRYEMTIVATASRFTRLLKNDAWADYRLPKIGSQAFGYIHPTEKPDGHGTRSLLNHETCHACPSLS